VPEKAGAAVAELEIAPSPQESGTTDAPARFAVFSDVHGNLPALLACQAAMESENYSVSYCCGDLVGYGAQPNECMDRVLGAGIPSVLGNHEKMTLTLNNLAAFNDAAQRAITWTARTLAPENRARLSALPLVRRAGEFTFVHSSPYEPGQWHYVLTRGAARLNFQFFDGWICFIGHSHQPFAVTQAAPHLEDTDPLWAIGEGWERETEASYPREVLYAGPRLAAAEPGGIALDRSRRYLVNVGSVGQPRDTDPRACYVTVDLAAMRLRFHRVEYPVAEAQRAIVAAGLPVDLARRLALGR
jgi:diadenosine tetraphosphatase ApaH/serine/threonine PP2A family protein phosphatase